jgi:hypothetical protein
MFIINPNNKQITLTRGDTAILAVELKNQDGTDYEIQTGDKLVMTVKESITDTEAVISKTADNDVFTLEPSDTIGLCGVYEYDIQLTTADGDVYTPIQSEIEFKRGVTE